MKIHIEPNTQFTHRLGAMAEYVTAAHRMVCGETVGLYLVDFEETEQEARFNSQSLQKYVEEVELGKTQSTANEGLELLTKVIDANALTIAAEALVGCDTMRARYLVWLCNALQLAKGGLIETVHGLYPTVWDRQERHEYCVVVEEGDGIPVATRSDLTPKGPALPELAGISDLINTAMVKLTMDLELATVSPEEAIDGPEWYVMFVKGHARFPHQ